MIAGLTGDPALSLAAPAGHEGTAELDLALERAFVLFELKLFEQDYLPVLQAPLFLDHSHGTPHLVRWPWPARKRLLAEWQTAARRLFETLSRPAGTQGATLDPTEFEPLFADSPGISVDLLTPPPHPCFVRREGRIYWQVNSRWEPSDPERRAEEVLHYLAPLLPAVPRAAGGSAVERLRQYSPLVNDWYLETAPLVDGQFAAFDFLLPQLAEFDPALAVKALDRQRMKRRVRHDPQLLPNERAKRLKTLDGRIHSSCLSCSLALAMETLANNHFCKIGNLLELPELYGSWNSFMAPFLFRTLYRKVEVLRRLVKTAPSGMCSEKSTAQE